jgi:chemotaxis protein CheZ
MEKAGEIGGEQGDAITNEVMKIFEACSFQDITGQRITKVVKTLKDIESKVSSMLEVIASRIPGLAEVEEALPEEDDTRSEDEKLLNGPQMSDQAISQEDIDKLLSDF